MDSPVLLFFSLLSMLFLASCDHQDCAWDRRDCAWDRRNCANYFWRDYYGTTPNDAVPAGKDHTGKYRYIGLVYIPGRGYLTATILPELGIARTVAYGIVFNATKLVQILCSPHQSAFEWTPMQSENLSKFTNLTLIPGGSEVLVNLRVGRVINKDNDPIIGKVFPNEGQYKGIWYPDGGQQINTLTYEILSYNCEKAFRCEYNIKTGTTRA